MLYVDNGYCFGPGLYNRPDLGGGLMNMVRKCDCRDCEYFIEQFIEEFDEYWQYCRKQKTYISVGLRATCREGVKRREGSDD